jgi:hypothetical protein
VIEHSKNAYQILLREYREDTGMSTVIEAPLEMVEAVANLRLPTKTDERLQHLMDRNNNGELTPEQQKDLESLVELSETLGIVHAQAQQVLGRTPR